MSPINDFRVTLCFPIFRQKLGFAYFRKNEDNFSNKKGICVKETCQVCICTKFHVDILKNGRVLVFGRSKRSFFTLFPAISVFSQFSKLVRFGPFKKCSGVTFRVVDEQLTQEHLSRLPNPLFSVWPFLDLVTLNDLDHEYANRKLRMILRSIPDTIHVVVLTYLFFIRL